MELAVEGIHTYYGLSHVLHGVDLRVRPGELVGLLGRNGAGKTTTLRSIMGLTPPARGTISYNGEVISGKKPYQIARKGIAYVPEVRDVFSNLTVEENLTLAHDPRSPWTMPRILEWFSPLRDLMDRKGSNLSGGQQQMLVIARALMTGPQLLVLDEPSQGLAPLIVNAVLDILRELRKENLSVLLVEQSIRMAMELADRIYILSDGKIVHESPPEVLAGDPSIFERHIGIAV